MPSLVASEYLRDDVLNVAVLRNRRLAGLGSLAFGAILAAIGGGITWATYNSAEGGGTYVVLWGLILWGVVQMGFGVVKLFDES